jgi:thymidine kinase
MAKFYFRYGVMGAGKSIEILKIQYSYKESGMNVMLLKPSIDTRDGENTLRSRMGIHSPVICFDSSCDVFNLVENSIREYADIACVLIDEAQFMTPEQVEQIARVADDLDIPVITMGLLTDFKSKLFEGSKRLIELADSIEEIKTICWCGKKARYNARIIDGEVIKTGEQIQIGGNESYTRLCREHYMKSELGSKTNLSDIYKNQ